METKRLTIRNFQMDDWSALHEMIIQYQASEMAAYDQPWPTAPEEIQEITEWFASGDQFLAVCLKVTGQFIGFVGLNAERDGNQRTFNIGYIFNSDFHGHGYATEACKAVLGRAFGSLKAEQVVAGTGELNYASRRLLERLGFQKTGENMESFKTGEDGKPITFVGYHYALAKEEWEKCL